MRREGRRMTSPGWKVDGSPSIEGLHGLRLRALLPVNGGHALHQVDGELLGALVATGRGLEGPAHVVGGQSL